jgi:hypothetical protein
MKIRMLVATLLFSLSTFASPVDGTIIAPGRINPGIGFAYNVTLRENEKTVFDVVTKIGDVNCELYLRNVLIIKITDGNSCNVVVTPNKTQQYMFIVINEKDTRAEYTTFIQ